MKKYILLFFIAISVHYVKSQDIISDSLKTQLSKSTRAIDSFSLITKISEHSLVLGGGAIDSGNVIRLLKIAQKLKNDSLLAISYNWIGSYMAFNSGENTAALEFYFKAIPLAENAKDKRRISSLYFDISLIYLSLKNKDEAFKNTIKGGENLPDTSSSMYSIMLMQFQRNMAAYYLLNQQYDSAIHYAQLLMETSRTIKSLSFQFGAFYLIGSIYAKMGDNDLAEVYFQKAVVTSKFIQNKAGLLSFYDIYVPYLLHNGRIREAKNEAAQLLELGREDNNNNLKFSAAGFLQLVFDSLQENDSAYYYAKLKDQLSATIFSQNNINKMQSLAFNEKLRILDENEKKVEEDQKRKENLQYASLAIGIIILVILYLLLSRSFITNNKMIEYFGIIALLIIFEFLNLLLHPFLERLTNHSPVWMLMSLVCIAALLVPLHHRAEKWATQKLIDKNRKIRLAAAKKTILELEGTT